MEQHGLILNTSRPAALATLIRIVGDFDLAEDAVQEASCRAVADWQKNGLPENPVAWLVQTGRRIVIDNVRRAEMAERSRQTSEPLIENAILPDDDEMVSTLHQHDDQLRLIFTCCHPALSIEAQVALTLKTVAGLTIDEIARAYLLPTATMQRRVSRAKEKIRAAAIPYEVPGDENLVERLGAVMKVIYLIYNQAYTSLKSNELLDRRLSESAIYLARMLNRLIRNNAEVQSLLSLLLFQHARADAREDRNGLPIPMEQQDRALWDKRLIAEGSALLEKYAQGANVGVYRIQATIAEVHCSAAGPEETDWRKIVRLYEQLEALAPNPVVTLNRAIAVSRLRGAGAGLVVLDSLSRNKQMNAFQYFHSTRAALLEEAGNFAAARASYERSKSLCQNDAEKRFLVNRIRALQELDSVGDVS